MFGDQHMYELYAKFNLHQLHFFLSHSVAVAPDNSVQPTYTKGSETLVHTYYTDARSNISHFPA